MASYDLNEAIRRWLNRKLEQEDRKQAGVARALHVKEERFHHWLTGYNRIPMTKLNDIARYFGFSDDATFVIEVRRQYPAPAPPHIPKRQRVA